MDVVCKIWLENKGKAFGEGPCELLRRVEKSCSLHQAADEMGMSYSKAWKLVQTMEKRLGFVLLDRKVGGTSGGGSRVTSRGKDLLKRYERFEREARGTVEETYRRYFSEGDMVRRKKR